MKWLALERTVLLLKTLFLTAMIGGLIPTLAFAQSSQITNYYGSASPTSPVARLNGSVTQSSSNGNSNGMRMMRSQAASAPAPAPAYATNQSLLSSDAMSRFGAPPAGNSSAFNSAANYTSQANSTGTANGATNNNAGASNDDQSQSGASHFDYAKAISLGASALRGVNQLIAATRPPQNPLYGTSQMTNSLLNRSTFMAGASAGEPMNMPGGGPSFLTGSANQLFHIGRPLTHNEVNLLGNYDVAVIIDKSGSMQTPDCPGGMRRWDFCREQVLSLTSQTASAFRSGITVAVFSSGYQVFNNVSFSAVPQIFAANEPDGGTYLANPMRDILSHYFNQRDNNRAMNMPTKPLLVEVITDGEPSDKGALIRVICDATQKMTSAREVNIQFLQIGNDYEGSKVLNELQTRLVSEDGAQYGIVNVEPFQAVLGEGPGPIDGSSGIKPLRKVFKSFLPA